MKSIALVIRPALACLIVFASLWTGDAEAAVVLHTDDNGKLVGASGVRVDGRTLNVRFFDGNCAEPFSGCWLPWDTPFLAPQAAAHASDALRRYVLIDAAEQLFDSNPALTFGCDDPAVCSIVTFENRYMSSYAAVNLAGAARDRVWPTDLRMGDDYDFSMDDKATVALWQDVTIRMPEPSTVALLCLSFLVMGWTQSLRRSRNRSTLDP